MERKSTSLIIYGFALITFLYFIPSCQASRKLADFPPQNNPVGEEHDDPSKSGAHGDTPPTGKFNTPPYPTSYPTYNNRGSYTNQNNGYAGQTGARRTTSNNGNCQYNETVDAYGRKHVTFTGNGCNNHNGYQGGQLYAAEYYSESPPAIPGYGSLLPLGLGNDEPGHPP
ncbi:uncharacterized protein LOC123217794 [Mangifera indica]|uniref:uncharacterized protein LOC123217794 n=1 Tax=Mangifera indica TaxID=29780 RepID=UPI001CF9DEF4|nr:uncharacterized protein LOC123217794 [Mangifera indica]